MPELAAHDRPLSTPVDSIVALLVSADRSFVQFAREELNQTSGPPVCLLHASTLADAQARLGREPVAVVLLDRWLPDGDGLEWLRTHRSTLQAGVLMLTAMGTTPDEPSPVALGAQDLLVKASLDGDHLARSIRYAAERERMRQELLKSRAHFQSLIEHATDLITVVDRHGCVLYQSPAAAMLLGTAPQVHHDATFPELVHPEDAARARQLIEEVFSLDGTPRGEFRLPHADGSMRTFDVIASRMRPDEGPARAVLNGRDITERCQAEAALRLRDAELREAQKMEAVGRLAGGVAHDFSNILTVIAGACERLQDDIRTGQASPAHVEVIVRHCARATALTRQLLTFSRQQTIALRPVDLAEVLERSRELLSQLVGDRVALDIAVEPGLWSIEADPVQMEQVLMNLAVNGRDAMPDGGQLHIAVGNVVVGAAEAAGAAPLAPGDYVRLDVSDTGCGMTAETAARAFEPFFTTKGPALGTGLGLATVHGIVTESRGHIRVDSEPGRGTRFEIHLPASEPGPQPLRRPTPPVEQANPPRTILVAEDDPDLRTLLAETLTAQGYTVIEAGSARGAVQATSVQPQAAVDLLLTDLVLPGTSGDELAQTLRARWPDLKVLYMSGGGQPWPGDVHAVAATEPYLAKPFSRQQLLHAIDALLA